MPAKADEHPLRRLVSRNPFLTTALPEVILIASPAATSPRDFRPANVVSPQLEGEAHVLLLDDTWVGGGHAQSCAAALKMAGAGAVSILNIARWLDPRTDVTAKFLPDGFDSRTYNPRQCPWTGGQCP